MTNTTSFTTMHVRLGTPPLLAGLVCMGLVLGLYSQPAQAGATVVETPYEEQKVVIEYFYDHPEKLGSGLYWLRAIFKTLNEEPYAIAPDFIDIKVIIHGTEIVTLAKKNYHKYKDVVERMRYYTEFGVEFKVCMIAAHEYGYEKEDFYDFVQLVPNAMTELVHWQSKGYGLVIPQVLEKNIRMDEIR